ncbi:discoidin domain-containing receptor 2 [Boleophthalmus pectinirostris]|uniref:discoidin domain-containing receptor 2 n=1 Tax=Boleophthalmus pectinirostris TaxID=150288 RepID=UPI00242DE0B0|nr:discoidin domain-containing receptor 2 [Boleophthalmus pectinirostris]
MLLCVLLFFTAAASGQIDPSLCRYALGLEDGRIRNEALSASSQWHFTTGPQYARLNREEGDGAWCPQVASDSQYLQVDLGRLTFLTVVGTQGRYAHNSGNEFARAYRLNYSRDGVLWKSWRNRQGNTVLEGNTNAYASVLNDLHPPVITRFVRVLPVPKLSSTVCMRLELYGCNWEDGLVSYSAPEGHFMTPPGLPVVSLNDSTYDGSRLRGRWVGGLGQLTDGVTGLDDFLSTRQYQVRPGYDYMGWKNQSLSHVSIEFTFDRTRNFTHMKVHSNNMFSRGVKIFSSVSCEFKPRLLGRFGAERVEFRTVLDDRNPSARYVTVPLGRAGRVVRCNFTFADVWMMFSEISFHSEDAVVTETTPLSDEEKTTSAPVLHPTATVSPHSAVVNASSSPAPEDGSSAVLIGCLVSIILLLLVVIFLILWCQCVCKVLEKAPRRILEEEVTVRLSSCSDTIVLQTPPVPPRNAHTHGVNSDPHYERVFLLDPQYQNPAHLRNKLPELSQSAEASACGGGYAEPDVTQCTPHQSFQTSAPHYAETDIVRLQGVTGSNMYAVPALTVDSLTRKDISAAEIPRHRLHFREKLGEGQFGEVHLCEAEGLLEVLGSSRSDSRSVLVAVKQLRPDATSQARNDFLKEIKIMSRLNDPNIIRLLCVCVTSDPLCMVTEYMENGDLNMFLSQREIESTLTHANNIPSVSLAELLHMSVQIASGMKYLASLNFVHRDLATRNCLLDRRLTIKISDFGMSRNLYSSDYYRIQGRAVLPIRWMAWESILLGKFTTASDVWAFGVTLWEMFTLCKEQPYSLLSDEQVIENTGEHFRNQGRQIFLYAPPLCPPSLFELMMRCWSRNIQDRPTFEGLYQALRPHAQ